MQNKKPQRKHFVCAFFVSLCIMAKKRVGRPTKLTAQLIKILDEVVGNAIYLTDEDLVEELNERLSEKDRISLNTFKDYKSGRKQSENLLLVEFSTLIKKALRREKINLLSELSEGEQGWQAKAWILERKFSEWNLKQITETDITSKGESINDIKKISFKNTTKKEDDF